MFISLLLLQVCAEAKKTPQTLSTQAVQSKDKKWQDLERIMRGLYENNAEITLEENKVRTQFENYAQARAELFPKVEAQYEKSRNSAHTTKNPDAQAGYPYDSSYSQDTGRLELSYNLAKGGKDLGQTRKQTSEIQSASWHYFDVAEQKTLELFDVIESIVYQKSVLSFLEASQKSNQKLIEVAESMFSAGAGSKLDIDQARAKLAENAAQSNEEMAKLQDFENRFLELTGMKAYDVEALPRPSMPLSYSMAEQMMLKDNPAIIATKYKVESAEHGKTIARSSNFPTVDLTGSVGYETHEDELIRPSRDASVRSRPDRRRMNKRLGLRIYYPLYTGGRNISEMRQASKQLATSKRDLQLTHQKLRIDLKQTWEQYQSSLKNVDQYNITVSYSKQALNNIMIEIANKTRTIQDALQQEEKLFEANKNQARNEKVLRMSMWKLKLLNGKLNPRALNMSVSTFDPLTEFNAFRRL